MARERSKLKIYSKLSRLYKRKIRKSNKDAEMIKRKYTLQDMLIHGQNRNI